MKIRWLGHACFYIETEGKGLITDPFDEKLGYPPFEQEIDIATVSHEHWDHNAVHVLRGKPRVIRGTGQYETEGIRINGFPSFHDKKQGADRGQNTIFKISAEGLDILHLGDLGHLLLQEEIDLIGHVDILLIPVGGTFTIDADEAFELVEKLQPGIIIPMHFDTPHLSFDLAPVEAFTAKFDKTVKRPYLEVDKGSVQGLHGVIVLDYLQR